MKSKDVELIWEAYTGDRFDIMDSFEEWALSSIDDPKFLAGVENYDYTFDSVERQKTLYLGTIEKDGGDYMFDYLQQTGKLQDLINFLNSAAKGRNYGYAVEVLPYTEYRWNEDQLGEEL